MIEEVQEGVQEYLRTHNTESQQNFGNKMKIIFDKPNDTNKKADEAYDKLIKEIKERDNKIYNLVDPDLLENYKSK